MFDLSKILTYQPLNNDVNFLTNFSKSFTLTREISNVFEKQFFENC